MKIINTKFLLCLLLGLLLSWGAVGIALFLQFYAELNPCPLCIFNRMILIGIGGIYFSWLLQQLFIKNTEKGFNIFFSLVSLGILSGLALSGYHSWLMHLPPEKLPSCGPDLSYLLETLPLHEVLLEAFKGSGSCAQDKWRFLGLFNIAQLALGLYAVLTALQIYLFQSKKND
jgi:disulfide bond formation protein DsbB